MYRLCLTVDDVRRTVSLTVVDEVHRELDLTCKACLCAVSSDDAFNTCTLFIQCSSNSDCSRAPVMASHKTQTSKKGGVLWVCVLWGICISVYPDCTSKRRALQKFRQV